jgi:hypothetical protein
MKSRTVNEMCIVLEFPRLLDPSSFGVPHGSLLAACSISYPNLSSPGSNPHTLKVAQTIDVPTARYQRQEVVNRGVRDLDIFVTLRNSDKQKYQRTMKELGIHSIAVSPQHSADRLDALSRQQPCPVFIKN